jgi:hypothetical protein
MKTIHVHIALWVILLVGGFLAGFVPEYRKNRELAAQLESPLKTIDALKLQLELGELRDNAGLMLLELSRQNYGLARDHASMYYNKLNDLISESRDESLKKSLTELSATRDSLMVSLGTATSNSLTVAQPIVLRTFEVTRNVGGK